VFCDIDNDSLCIDLEKAERLISPRTKAMIVMDYGCMLCDHDRVADIAAKHRLRIIHDAAHSFGAKYKGRMIGSFSDLTMFSFDPVKTITCIDGGALVVESEGDVERLHAMRLLGMKQSADVMYQNSRAWTYDIESVGYRYHMANLHAALGLSQLEKISEIIENRRLYCRFYNQYLEPLEAVGKPDTDFVDVAPFLYYIRVPASLRDGLRDHLHAAGIDTGIHWRPGHAFSLFRDCRRGDLSITEQVGGQIVTLPLHSRMKSEDLEYIVDKVQAFFRQPNARASAQARQ
jgi:dTDP-4-amino-4,6-dideoxygalactose transaminase